MSSKASHYLQLYTPIGVPSVRINDPGMADLNYGLRDNEPGVLEFSVPYSYDKELFVADTIVEVYRKYGGFGWILEGETAFFIRRVIDTGSYFHIVAYSAMSLLGRHAIAYYAGTSYTDKVSILYDDLLREFVDENMGPGASYAPATIGGAPGRDLTPWFSIEADKSLGTSYSKSAAWRNLLETSQEIIDDVRSAGTRCSFDVVRTGIATFEFRVFVGPRGLDHSEGTSNEVIVSKQRKNLAEPVWDENWEGEKNFIFGTGQGQEDERIVKFAQDSTRMNIGPFGRNEAVRDARQSSTPEGVQAEANAALQEFRPIRTFTGKILQTPGCVYNVHWKWGDLITVHDASRSVNCYVDSVVVSKDGNGTEFVEGNLRSVTNV